MAIRRRSSFTGYPRGRAKIGGGGAVQYGLPGVDMNTVTTLAVTVNTDRTTWFEVQGKYPIAVDQVTFEVTTAPASNANVRVAVYAADADLQPTGSPLIEFGVPVASGFVGKKTTNVSATLPPGQYCACINVDVAMTLRAVTGGALIAGIYTGMGTTPFIQDATVARAYGPFTTPTPWTTLNNSATPARNTVVFRWTP